jgi:hydroxyacylglutathione hydrolase
MFIKQILTGGDRNFGYVAADDKSGSAVIIDPSYDPAALYSVIRENGFTLQYVFCTHDHHDHTNGNSEIMRLSGIKPVVFGETESVSGLKVADRTEYPLGELVLKIIHTPGHTADSICVLVEDALFTGDTLFVGKVGGTSLGDDARQEYDSLHNGLLTLPGSTRVFPGHNVGVSNSSTIDDEKKTNPFLTQPDFESFLYLKKNWAEYKREHGIS